MGIEGDVAGVAVVAVSAAAVGLPDLDFGVFDRGAVQAGDGASEVQDEALGAARTVGHAVDAAQVGLAGEGVRLGRVGQQHRGLVDAEHAGAERHARLALEGRGIDIGEHETAGHRPFAGLGRLVENHGV